MRWLPEFPGLTRDRKYGRAEVEGREFICIDTGGIDGTERAMETRMAEQSLLAIEEADVVLFMVDARAGLMPADIAIAKLLRSREKPTFLVANKTDGIDVDRAIADFWSLGRRYLSDCRFARPRRDQPAGAGPAAMGR